MRCLTRYEKVERTKLICCLGSKRPKGKGMEDIKSEQSWVRDLSIRRKVVVSNIDLSLKRNSEWKYSFITDLFKRADAILQCMYKCYMYVWRSSLKNSELWSVEYHLPLTKKGEAFYNLHWGSSWIWSGSEKKWEVIRCGENKRKAKFMKKHHHIKKTWKEGSKCRTHMLTLHTVIEGTLQ